MTHAQSLAFRPFRPFRPLRLLPLVAALVFSLAHADEYSDVSQLVRNGKLSDALTKADQYLVAKPRDPQMRFLKGVIQRDSGKPTDAIATFTRLTEDYPELPEPYNNLAVLYAGQSQFDKARTALEMAIRTNPSYATAHENLGDVYAKLASQAYNKALQLDSTNPAVAPKLALIRELFAQPGTKGQRPAAGPAAAAATPVAVAATPAPASTPIAAKPVPGLPGPISSKPATVAPATPPAPAQPVVPVAAAATTPLPAPTVAAVTTTPPASNSNARDAEAAVYAWARAWAERDVKGYLASYGKDFDTPGSMSRGAWEDERRQRIGSKSKISVKLEHMNVSVDGNKAVAKFRQDYKASGLAVSTRKSLDLVKSGDHWLIVKESTGS